MLNELIMLSELNLQWSIDNTEVFNETELGPGVYKTHQHVFALHKKYGEVE